MTSASTDASEGNPYNFCLKWSNYQSHVLNVLVQLLQSETMVDVTLCAAGGERVCAHRIVLSAASSYFQEILACSEDSHPVVILSDVSAEDMHSILEFVYHGELNVDASQLTSVLQVAAALQIKGLMEVCDQLPTLVPVDDTSEGEAVLSQDVDASIRDSTPSSTQEECPDPNTMMLEQEENDGTPFDCDSGSHSMISNRHSLSVEESAVPVDQTQPDGVEDDGALQSLNLLGAHMHKDQGLKKIRSVSRAKTNEILQLVLKNKKRTRRENSRRDYSEEQLAAALNDLSAGHMLVETATAHHIPRSTLYTRAKAAGISLHVARQEHSNERVQAAIQAVTNGSSLQQASLLYQIPKTVLWRRVRAAGGREGWIPRRHQTYGIAHRQAAIQALQSGQNLSKVSAQFQIPKTTLFREKTRLIEAGKLPSSSLKKRDTQSSAMKHSRIKEAVAACKEGKMSQAAASLTFQVPKTTIWRRLRKCGISSNASEKVHSSGISNGSVEVHGNSGEKIPEQVAFSFCESNNQIPVAYIVAEGDFTEMI